MSNIKLFTPRADLTASENVNVFIEFAKNELTLFGAIDWDSNHWDVSDYMKLKGRDVSINLNFTDLDTIRNAKSTNQPLSDPFNDFAKAFMRYRYGLNPEPSVRSYIQALRVLERALVENGGSADITRVDASILNRSEQIAIGKWKSPAGVGGNLERIAEFMDDHYFTPMPLMWKSSIPPNKNTPKRVGPEADAEREKKLPTPAARDALAKAFVMATEPRDIIVSAIGALLVSSPDRANELVMLPEDCEVYQELYGKEVFGIRWWPSKGAEPMVKWIVETMKDVAIDAIKRIKELTAEARKMALWYEKNPEKLYLPEGFEHLRNQKFIYANDLQDLLGMVRVHPKRVSKRLGFPYEMEKIGHGNIRRARIKFADFEKAILKTLPKDFPYLDTEKQLKFSESLFVVPDQFFRGINESKVMFVPVTWDYINRALNGKTGKFTVFDRLGLKEPDGSRVFIGTHQLRHWLNTLAQKGGLSQLDIAKWSGRKSIHQNAAYDHISANEMVEMIRETDDGSMFGPLAELATKSPISRDEFMALKIPTAHITEIGFCIHDWTMLSCQRHRDCVNCTESVCIKGDEKKTTHIKEMLFLSEIELEKAEAALDESYSGADRWLEHHRITVKRLRNLVEILDDPQVLEGSVIQLSITGEYSPIFAAIEDRSLLQKHN